MTNAEKYLKDEVSVVEFAKAISMYIADGGRKLSCAEDIRFETLYFLNDEAKPTLTEDEKVILSNLKEFNYIGRDEESQLYLQFKYSKTYTQKYDLQPLRHLFQFIKNGEEYSIKELLK